MVPLLLVSVLALPPQQSDAIVGVAAIHVESGRRLTVRGEERFPMGSVYKIPIALAVLHRVDEGSLALDRSVTIEPGDFGPGWSPLRDAAGGKAVTRTIGELLREMVSVSDNTASDALLRLAGGPRAVSARMAALGHAGVRVDRSEAQIAADLAKPGGVASFAIDVRDTSTPGAMASLLFAIWRGRDGLSERSRELLLQLMTESATGARRIKAAVPPGATVMHKTGTMPGTVNDVAIVTSPDGREHVVIVIFTKKGTAPVERREDDVAAIAGRVYAELVGR